jgi:hypothetical protein
MAELELMALDESGRTFRTPAGSDTYVAKKAVNLEQPLSTDSTIDGRDIAVDGAVLDTAIQPGDSVTALADYEANAELASQADAETGSNNVKTMTPLRVTQAIAVMASGLKNNTSATTAPTATDDDSLGYAIGSFWVDTLADKAYRCVDASTNIAVWVDTTVSASDLAAVALSGDSDDLIEGSTNLLMTTTERANLAYITGNTVGITAYSGGGQANAIELTTRYNIVEVVAVAGDSTKLKAVPSGTMIVVKNTGVAAMDLFPNSGAKINKLATNAAISVPIDTAIYLFATSATQWESIG